MYYSCIYDGASKKKLHSLHLHADIATATAALNSSICIQQYRPLPLATIYTTIATSSESIFPPNRGPTRVLFSLDATDSFDLYRRTWKDVTKRCLVGIVAIGPQLEA